MKRAFSLIELMVVIAIVAVLAAAAVPAYNGYIDRAKMNKVLKNIQQSTEIWNQVSNTGDWFAWDAGDRTRPIPADMPWISDIYLNWDIISYSFQPGYFNREAITYVSYVPVLDGVEIDTIPPADASQINDADIISWQCVVSGIDGAYGGYTVLEFQQEYFPQCSCPSC